MELDFHGNPAKTTISRFAEIVLMILYNRSIMPVSELYNYLDYRDYLLNQYTIRKQQKPYYSYRVMGDRVGMDASQLCKVLQKSLHLADKFIQNFCGYLELEGKDADYFHALVRFCKARTAHDSRQWYDRMLVLREVDSRTLEMREYEFYTAWWHSAIRALVSVYRIKDDYEELGSMLLPPIEAEQARTSVELLEKLGLLARDAEGYWVPTEQHITTGREFQSMAIRGFQEDTIRLGMESLKRAPRKSRSVSTLTMSVDAKAFKAVEEILRETRKAIIKRVNEVADADRVMQLNMQLFPLSKRRPS
jgi:uncharacterized protein (TIGR02147 family)